MSTLDELKAQCQDGETAAEHEAHAAQLAAAYATLAAPQASNPAPQGVTELSAHVVVNSDLPS